MKYTWHCYHTDHFPVLRCHVALFTFYQAGHLNNAYRLVSIVSHIGSTSMNGHYISDVYDVEKKCWLSYDDSTVMKRDERRLREERRRTGYIFFYHAKEFLWMKLKTIWETTPWWTRPDNGVNYTPRKYLLVGKGNVATAWGSKWEKKSW